jgi:hypothetical protein
MRRWHKLLAPWFALILFVIAFTGAVTQATAILDSPPAKSATVVASGSRSIWRVGWPCCSSPDRASGCT